MRQPPPFCPKTVVFLGAGASKCAGYPLASELLPAVKKEADAAAFASLKSAWCAWEKYKSGVGGLEARLLSSPNPEIALSAIDLMAAALETEDEEARHRGFARAAEDFPAGARLLETYYSGEERGLLSEALVARSRLLQAMDWYFAIKHGELRLQPSSSRDFLRTIFQDAGLEAGDAVVTTNWDAVAELTLGEDGLWNPFDGYGFHRNLVGGFDGADGTPASLPDGIPFTSPVKVLKLHGSFGWREALGQVYLDFPSFLQHLPFKHRRQLVVFRDAADPRSPSRDELLLLYPSFLKRIRTPELHLVWKMAGDAIRTVRRVVVVGYSLPEADLAVRTLLLPLRFRATDAEVGVEVIDVSDESLARWQEFMEGNAQEFKMSVCQ